MFMIIYGFIKKVNKVKPLGGDRWRGKEDAPEREACPVPGSSRSRGRRGWQEGKNQFDLVLGKNPTFIWQSRRFHSDEMPPPTHGGGESGKKKRNGRSPSHLLFLLHNSRPDYTGMIT
jgi:hypothetical protein